MEARGDLRPRAPQENHEEAQGEQKKTSTDFKYIEYTYRTSGLFSNQLDDNILNIDVNYLFNLLCSRLLVDMFC